MRNIIAARAETTSLPRLRTYWLWDLLSHALNICWPHGPSSLELFSTSPIVTISLCMSVCIWGERAEQCRTQANEIPLLCTGI